MMSPADPPSRFGFVLVPGFSMLAYSAAVESLRAANQISGRTLYSWKSVSPAGRPIAASNGIEFHCDAMSGDEFDYVFVCASDEGLTFRDPAALAWLRAQASHGAAVGGIGGGAFTLAYAGLLGGRKLTLHWAYAPVFAEQFPEADLRRSLYEIDGNRMTCGGGMASLDMLHALIRQHHGPALAARISDWFLHTEIRDGQSPQRLSFQARLGVSHPGVIRVLEAMEDAIEDPLSRKALTAISGLSARQLDRLFLKQVGTQLGLYYLRLRLERARRLVLQSSMSQLQVAISCGFRSASTFSKAYRAAFGVPPTVDRAAVRQALRPTHAWTPPG